MSDDFSGKNQNSCLFISTGLIGFEFLSLNFGKSLNLKSNFLKSKFIGTGLIGFEFLKSKFWFG